MEINNNNDNYQKKIEIEVVPRKKNKTKKNTLIDINQTSIENQVDNDNYQEEIEITPKKKPHLQLKNKYWR